MENYSYAVNTSYPDSVNSSPRSRDDNATWEEREPNNYKVKLVCSYGGKIQPRPHDNQLTYVGGDTKILAVERNVKFTSFISKLTSLLSESEVSFKYQLPGEDLDALISVTNDEDLEHMMLEYDRLCKSSAKPARLRLFLFELKPSTEQLTSSFGSTESKSERQWFVDALNSVNLEGASPPSAAAAAKAAANNADFLFNMEKGHVPHAPHATHVAHAPSDEAVKVRDQIPPPVNEVVHKEVYTGGEVIRGEQMVSPAEYQRQVEEMQRLQISGHDQSPREYVGDYGGNNYQQSVNPPPQMAVPVNNPAGYWTDRQVATGPYPVQQNEQQQPVYLIQTAGGVYQAPAMRQVTGQQVGQVGQGYYGMQRMVPEVYREQQVYSGIPQQAQQQQQQQQQQGGPYNPETYGMVRAPVEGGYPAQVSYDASGRPVYYTTPGV